MQTRFAGGLVLMLVAMALFIAACCTPLITQTFPQDVTASSNLTGGISFSSLDFIQETSIWQICTYSATNDERMPLFGCSDFYSEGVRRRYKYFIEPQGESPLGTTPLSLCGDLGAMLAVARGLSICCVVLMSAALISLAINSDVKHHHTWSNTWSCGLCNIVCPYRDAIFFTLILLFGVGYSIVAWLLTSTTFECWPRMDSEPGTNKTNVSAVLNTTASVLVFVSAIAVRFGPK